MLEVRLPIYREAFLRNRCEITPTGYNCEINMAKEKHKKWTKARHRVVFFVFWPFFWLLGHIRFGLTAKRFKTKKRQNYLILSNHCCSMDPFFVSISFPGKPVYFVSSDDLLRIKFASFWIKWMAAPIPKQKDVADFRFAAICKQIAEEGGNIGIFPEGNRTYSGKLGPIDEGIAKLAKALGLPVLLYRIENGYGVDPRWAKKIRRGKMKGGVVWEISAEEVSSSTPEALLETIREGLSSPLDHSLSYRSKCSAECLERVLYVCPRCRKLQTLRSSGNTISCSSCGLSATYEPNMTFRSDEPEFPFETVADWYDFQKKCIAELDVSGASVLLRDEKVKVFFSHQSQPKKQMMTGTLTMSKKGLRVENYVGELQLSFSEIRGVGITGKNKVVCYTHEDDSYTFVGEAGFNAYKYSQMYAKIMGRIENSL